MKGVVEYMLSRLAITLFTIIIFLFSCSNDVKIDNENNPASDLKQSDKKIGVLLVSHGSHSAKWREMLLAIEDSVRTEVMQNEKIVSLRSAYMEYTEPSIATRMKEFDDEGFTDVVIVPVFLTVSSHSFDDIPTIVGLKREQGVIDQLKSEKIDCYNAKANITITELLDFSDILLKNVVRRVNALSENPENESLALIAYGDEQYNVEWTALMNRLGETVQKEVGIDVYGFDWCGHIVHYDVNKTTNIVDSLLTVKEKAIVVPILVAFDEMFQIDIIGGGLKKVKKANNVVYKPDAILPDENIEAWVEKTIDEAVNGLH